MARSASFTSQLGWVALTALLAAMQVAAIARPPTFVVQVEEGQLEQVVAAYKARGFEIRNVHPEYGFLKVAQPLAVTSGMGQHIGGRAAPMANVAPWAVKQMRGLSPGDTAAGPIYPRGGAAAVAASPEMVAPTWTSAAEVQIAAMPMASSPSIASTIAALSEVPGVDNVEVNVHAHLMMRKKSFSRMLKQAANIAAICPVTKPKNGPDTDTGKYSEGAPYGVSMVQADHPEMIEVSKEFAEKVIFCVIDTGLDRKNIEFNGASRTGGCEPNTMRRNGNATKCIYNWWDDTMGHGTHTSGTIGAMRNGKGIYGVSAEGAQIYHVNAFGDSDTFDFSDIVMSWDDCLHELDTRKAATNQPDMKMVISMSLGAGGDLAVVRNAVKKITSERNDVLFLSAAGNGGSSATAYPAGYPEVVSIAAVDWNMNKAHFSQYNSDVEWAAPGVQVLSTIPTQNAGTSSYNLRPRVVFDTPTDVLQTPGPLILPGGATGKSVSGEIVDCGLGLQPCKGAKGKVCLIQRGEATFCSKVNNCLEGGGIATIIFEKESAADRCAPVSGATLHDPSCDEPRGGWPVVLTTSLTQGLALKAMLSEGPSPTVTLDTRVGHDVPALEFMSGTSMATPNAAGVAGLVWSAHTECTASELRRAISATALDKGAPGRDENFGFGVIQSLAAHHYLKANPCGGRNVNFDRISTNPVTPSEESGRAAQTYEITIPAAMSAPVNERVALPYVLSPKTPCPSSGEPVVSAVTIGRRLRRCLPALEYVALREARTSIKETCNPAQSRGQFAFAASRAHAQAGDCYELEVTTMDNQVHHSILMFTE